MRKTSLAIALSLFASAASADLCLLGAIDSTCAFATDTSGGTAFFTNPANLSNIGSGVITPFLGTQAGGSGDVEFGVSTDIPQVNLLPLDDKRDNANTFTTTFRLDELGYVTILGETYFSFFLDINEPGSDPAKFLSLDTLRIWGRTGLDPAESFLATNVNVTTLGDVDLFPNLQLVYALGPNTLVMDYSLFAGSGLGYDVNFLIPTSEFAGLATNSRIVFGVGYGGAETAFAGTLAQDGFEEWAYLPGNGPPPPPPGVPEPSTLALLGASLLGIGFVKRPKHPHAETLS